MSIARRDPKWKSRSLSWAGHALLLQRQTASPSAREAAAPQAGHAARHLERLGLGRPPLDHDVDEVGDHVARALDEDGVADADVLLPHLVLVVEAHVGHGDAGQLHRLEPGRGRERARLPHVHRDLEDARGGLAGGELEGDGPARMVRGGAEPALLLEVVHLHDHAVGLVRQAVALGLEAARVGDDAVEVGAALRPGIDGAAALAQRLQRLPVGAEADLFGRAHVVQVHVERPRRRRRGVLLPHRAGGGVPRVGERGLPRLLQRGVQPPEGLERHEDLAAHLEARTARPAVRAGARGWSGSCAGSG